jgi:hypothetical protein
MVTVRKAIFRHWRLSIVAARQDCKLSLYGAVCARVAPNDNYRVSWLSTAKQAFAHAPTSMLNFVLGAPGVSATNLARGPPELGSPRSEMEAALDGGDWQRTPNQTSPANLPCTNAYCRIEKRSVEQEPRLEK